MNDMSQVIIPKSDQWNADDFIAGPMTFTIKEVRISPGSEQPVSIVLEGTDKFYRPCKSMSRVLVQAWGADAKAYVGKSLTLYRDPSVKWAGMEIGGIRISHMSDIDAPKQMMLTATKGSRKPFKVMPLVARPAPSATDDPATKWANGYIAKLDTFSTLDAVQAFQNEKSAKLAELEKARPDLHKLVTDAIAGRIAQLSPSEFEDDLGPDDEEQPEETQPNPATNDTLAATLAKIEAAFDERELKAIEKDVDGEGIFLTANERQLLDEALAKRREELRAKEATSEAAEG